MPVPDWKVLAWSAIVGIVGILVGLEIGQECGYRRLFREAVRTGHAEWQAAEDGSSVGRWKEVIPAAP